MQASDNRFPDIAVTANGYPIGGIVHIGVESNSFLGADRFRISTVFDAANYKVWSSNGIDIVINVGLDGRWQQLIQGPVDRVEVDAGAAMVHIDGRDLTARFLEAKTQETFENRTASEVAQLLASRRGLVSNVSPTTALVGRSFGGDYTRVTLDQYSAITTEWDLLTKLASGEGYDVWVDGQTLNFMPPLNSLSPIVMSPSDCESLRMDRALALSGGLDVTVRSWDCRANASVSQIASNGNGGQSYVLVKPNLTDMEAANLARRVLAEMSQSARVIVMDIPGELLIKPRQSLLLVGTETDFDGTYVITSVDRALSFQRGFTQTLQARTPPWTIS